MVCLSITGRQIQKREHCSVEDARAAMDLYKSVEQQWENDIINTEQTNIRESRQKLYAKRNLDTADNQVQDNCQRRHSLPHQHSEESFLDDSFWPDDINYTSF